jgi:outer membrane protein assembly factor BamB
MREPTTPPELPNWPEDDSSESFVMIQTSTGEGRKRIRFFFGLGTFMIVGALLISTAPVWLTAVQREKDQLFPPPPYTGPVLAMTEQNESTLWGINYNTGQTVWSFKPISSQSQPILVGKTIVAISGDSLVGIALQSGKRVWQIQHAYIDNPPVLSLGNAQQIIAWYPTASDQTHSVYQAIDGQTGQVKWRYQSDGADYPMLPNNGKAQYFCTIDPVTDQEVKAQALALDDATGKTLWTTRTVQSGTKTQGGSCFVTAKQIFIDLHGATADDVWAFSLADGQPLWNRTIPNSIAFDEDRLYATNWYFDQPQTTPPQFTAYDAATGKQLWQISEQLQILAFQPTTSEDNGILGAKTPNGIAGVDITTGTVRWRFDAQEQGGNPITYWLGVFDGGNTIFYYNQRSLYAIDSATGAVRWQHTLAQVGQENPVVNLLYRDKRVYLTIPHALHVYDATTGKQLWGNSRALYPLG